MWETEQPMTEQPTSVSKLAGLNIFSRINHPLGEELQDAPKALPKIIILSVVLNGIMGFAMLLALMFCLGDPMIALSSPSGFAVFEVFKLGQESLTASTALVSLVLILIPLVAMNLLVSCSRIVWALARDNALPFSKFFAHVSTHSKKRKKYAKINSEQVDPRNHVPVRASMFTVVVLLLLGLITIQATSAFYAIVSASVISLYISYVIPVLLIAKRRLHDDSLQWGPFKLGRFGILINLGPIVYTFFICIFLCFPTSLPVTAKNMNYSSLIVGGVTILSCIFWIISGRKRYHGPLIVLQSSEAPESK